MSAFAIAYVQMSISDFACARARKQTHTHTQRQRVTVSLSLSLSLFLSVSLSLSLSLALSRLHHARAVAAVRMDGSYLKTVNQSFACCRCIFNLSIFCCGVSSHHAPKTDQRMLHPFNAPSRKPEAAPLALAPSCKVKLQEKVKLKARFRALEPPNQGP